MKLRQLFRPISLALLGVLLCLPRLDAQQPGAWNSAEVLSLIDRGIARRGYETVDTTLINYAADARGFVYFLLDAPELDRQNLVRTDQVALEVYWQSPDQIRQRIVGLRQRQELPVRRLYYYLDRLTVVQDNYGQGIVIADGDNVNDVPHPVAPGSPSFYDFRLADELTLRLPGLDEPVRVREIQVRPKDSSQPAILGSIFLEEQNGALVRMNFTFTPAAYVDPRLDYVNVVLENGLWEGRYWLPYEQRLEIRREIPELDLPFGTVIRTRMRISGYRFNQDLPPGLFAGRNPITFLPPQQRENFQFEQPIDAEWREEGIGQPAEVEEIRAEARKLLARQALSGLPDARPGARSISDIFRYNRAEGLFLGGGLETQHSGVSLATRSGFAFGPEHGVFGIDAMLGSDPAVTVSGYVNRLRDVGPDQPISGLANSLSSVVLGTDWSDPWYASGGALGFSSSLGDAGELDARIALERQRSASLETDYSFTGDGFRPVTPIDEGTLGRAAIRYDHDAARVSGGWTGWVEMGGGRLRALEQGPDMTFGGLSAGGDWFRTASSRRAEVRLEGVAGWLAGDVPVQERFYLGGRGTLPGYRYRSFVGDRFATAQLEASADLLFPWFRGMLFGTAGWVKGDATPVNLVPMHPTDGIRPSVGAGVGIFYDLLRVRVARGFGNLGRTEWIVDFQPDFWDFL